MGWIIDRDHFDEGGDTNPALTRAGLDEDFKHDAPSIKFRLLSDDRDLTYSGRINTADINGENANEESSFAPLDYGMADAGCTIMELFEDGKWSVL